MPTNLRVAVVFALAFPVCVWPSDRIVVGFGQVAPLHYKDARGVASGFVVDAINEAGLREWITILWKQVSGSHEIEPALVNGQIDLFPAAIVTDSCRSRFWISEPWWTEDLSLLARSDIGLDEHPYWQGRTIVLASQSYVPVASSLTPGAAFTFLDQWQPSRNFESSVPLLCSHKADAALLSHATLDDLLTSRPRICSGTDFRIIETAGYLPLAVLSRWKTRPLAERLARRIGDMGRDGTLMVLASRYPLTSARSACMLAETVRLRYKHRSLLIALGATLTIAIVVLILFFRQVHAKRALRSALAQQSTMEQILRARTQELTVSNEELHAFAYSISHDL